MFDIIEKKIIFIMTFSADNLAVNDALLERANIFLWGEYSSPEYKLISQKIQDKGYLYFNKYPEFLLPFVRCMNLYDV